jgi:hypothetical protein
VWLPPKPAANPWRSLPRLAAIFDQATPQSFFKGSKVDALEELSMTETQLLEQTAGLLGLTLPQLVRAGALVWVRYPRYSVFVARLLLLLMLPVSQVTAEDDYPIRRNRDASGARQPVHRRAISSDAAVVSFCAMVEVRIVDVAVEYLVPMSS